MSTSVGPSFERNSVQKSLPFSKHAGKGSLASKSENVSSQKMVNY
jgi:hypothetical protein